MGDKVGKQVMDLEKKVEGQFNKRIEEFEKEIKEYCDDIIQAKPIETLFATDLKPPVRIEVDNKEFIRVLKEMEYDIPFVIKIPVKYSNKDEICAIMYMVRLSGIIIFTKIMKLKELEGIL